MELLNNLNEIYIDDIVASLINNKLIICPADTMYGISASFDSFEALTKINEIKSRSLNKSFIILINSIDYFLANFDLDEKYLKILYDFWPGPLTVIVKPKYNKKEIFKCLELNGKIAVRYTTNNIALSIINKIKKPIVSTSVNLSNETPLNKIEDILKFIKENNFETYFSYIIFDKNIDGVNPVPSTIIDLTLDHPKILRLGAINIDLEKYEKNKI